MGYPQVLGTYLTQIRDLGAHLTHISRHSSPNFNHLAYLAGNEGEVRCFASISILICEGDEVTPITSFGSGGGVFPPTIDLRHVRDVSTVQEAKDVGSEVIVRGV
eukprot:GHVN01045728.1.p1 GENE.GHVN01045728.1~~GHVN01045728.1.p1  ORF type:complete len:105 (-),score=31.73 GHVN01045728.1:89-403(-)